MDSEGQGGAKKTCWRTSHLSRALEDTCIIWMGRRKGLPQVGCSVSRDQGCTVSVHGVHCTRTPLGNRDGAGGQLHMLTSLALSGLQLMRLFLLICSEGPSEPSA